MSDKISREAAIEELGYLSGIDDSGVDRAQRVLRYIDQLERELAEAKKELAKSDYERELNRQNVRYNNQ